MNYIKNPEFGKSITFTITNSTPRYETKNFSGKEATIVLLETNIGTLSISEKAYGKLRQELEISSTITMTKEQVGHYQQLCFYSVSESSLSSCSSGIDGPLWGRTEEELEDDVEELLDQGLQGDELFERLREKYEGMMSTITNVLNSVTA